MLGGEGEYRPQTKYRVQSRRSLDFPFKRVCIFLASSNFAGVISVGNNKDGLNPKHTVRQYSNHTSLIHPMP